MVLKWGEEHDLIMGDCYTARIDWQEYACEEKEIDLDRSLKNTYKGQQHVILDIPREFERDLKEDVNSPKHSSRMVDSLCRINQDLKNTTPYRLSGKYEHEIINMLTDSFRRHFEREQEKAQQLFEKMYSDEVYNDKEQEMRLKEGAIDTNCEVLADKIEQFMFERGEYDYPPEEQIRWVGDNAYEAEAVKRFEVTKTIREAILGVASDDIGGIEPLMEYLNGEIGAMAEDDELLQTAEQLITELNEVMEKQAEIEFPERE